DPHLLLGLDAVDGLLHARVEVLYAEAQAAEAEARERLEVLTGCDARVTLDRELGVGRALDGREDAAHEFVQLRGREEGRRAAAEVHFGERDRLRAPQEASVK